jgi:hypothetical protein
MNAKYMIKLFESNRTGLIIKLIKDNTHKWSIKNFQDIFNITYKITNYDTWFNIFYYIIEIFYKNNNIAIVKSFVFVNINYNAIKHILKKVKDENEKLNYYVISFKRGCQCDNLDMIKYIVNCKHIIHDYASIYINDLNHALNNKHYDIVKYVMANVDSYLTLIPTDKKSQLYSEMLLINL